jgi:hypothetical protein
MLNLNSLSFLSDISDNFPVHVKHEKQANIALLLFIIFNARHHLEVFSCAKALGWIATKIIVCLLMGGSKGRE